MIKMKWFLKKPSSFICTTISCLFYRRSHIGEAGITTEETKSKDSHKLKLTCTCFSSITGYKPAIKSRTDLLLRTESFSRCEITVARVMCGYYVIPGGILSQRDNDLWCLTFPLSAFPHANLYFIWDAYFKWQKMDTYLCTSLLQT